MWHRPKPVMLFVSLGYCLFPKYQWAECTKSQRPQRKECCFNWPTCYVALPQGFLLLSRIKPVPDSDQLASLFTTPTWNNCTCCECHELQWGHIAAAIHGYWSWWWWHWKVMFHSTWRWRSWHCTSCARRRFQEGSLWIAWLNAYFLKGRSIWQIPISPNYSWNLKKILQLRPLAQGFVEWKDGTETWKYKGSKYSAAVAWNEIRPKQEKKVWHRFLWALLSILKHVVIPWVVVLNRLPIKDRLASWGIGVDDACSFCQ